MQPCQKSISFSPKNAQIYSNQHLKRPQGKPQVMQVFNTAQQPVMNAARSSLKIATAAITENVDIQNQEEALNFLFGAMLEQKKFVCFEHRIPSMTLTRYIERFYNLELISAALYAQSSLFEMKTVIARLMVLETAGATYLKEIQTTVLKHLSAFMQQTLAYYKLFSIVQSEQKNEFSLEIDNYKKACNLREYAPKKKKRAEAKFTDKKANYEAFIAQIGISSDQINKHIYKYLNLRESWFVETMKKNLNFFSSKKIDNAIELIEIPSVSSIQLSTNQLLDDETSPDTKVSPSTASIICENQIEFTMKRAAVCEDFWNAFYSETEVQLYKTKFYQFMFTTWSSDYKLHKKSKVALSRAKKKKDQREFYQLVQKKYFRLKLKEKAYLLISEILKLKECYLISKNKRNIGKKVKDINKIVEVSFEENSYNQAERISMQEEMIKLDQLSVIEKKIENTKKNMQQNKIYVSNNISSNIEYINKVLTIFKKQHCIQKDQILSLARSTKQHIENPKMSSQASQEQPDNSSSLSEKAQIQPMPCFYEQSFYEKNSANIIFPTPSLDDIAEISQGSEAQKHGFSPLHQERSQCIPLFHFSSQEPTVSSHPSSIPIQTTKLQPNLQGDILEEIDNSRLILDLFDLDEFNLDHIKLNSINLDDIDLDNLDSNNIDLDSISLNDIDLNNVDLDSISFDDIDLNNVDSDNINFDDIDLNNVDWDNINFDDIDLNSVNFDDIDLNNIDLDNISLNDIDLNNVDWDNINFDDIDLNNINSNNVDLDNISLDDIDLDLDNVDLDSLDSDNIDLIVFDQF